MRTINVNTILNTTLSIWTRQLVPFALISAVFCLPVLLMQLLPSLLGVPASESVAADGLELMTLIASNVLTLLVSGALALATYDALQGREVAISESLKGAGKRLPTLIALSAVVGIATSLGLLMCIVPGVLLAIVWYVAVPAAMIEGGSFSDALTRSTTLTQGQRWQLFALQIFIALMAVSVILLVMLGGMAFVMTTDVDVQQGINPALTVGLTLIGYGLKIVTISFTAALATVTYVALCDVREDDLNDDAL